MIVILAGRSVQIFAGTCRQPQTLILSLSHIELPNSGKPHAWLLAVTMILVILRLPFFSHLLFLLSFPTLYFCFTLSLSSPSLFLTLFSCVICLLGYDDSRLHTYWSGEICDGLPSPGSIMSQSLLLFCIDPPWLAPEPCPLIPQTFRLANPAGLRMTPSKFLHLLNVAAALI